LAFFFNVFCYVNNARFSAELKTFDFSKEKKRKLLQKFVKSSDATVAFAEVRFKPETEIHKRH